MLTKEQLKTSCEQNGLYFCNSNFTETVADVLEEAPELINDDKELHIEVMSRMLSEHLDYGIASETEDEAVDGEKHSEMMAFRTDICDEIAQKWCDGDYKSLDPHKWLEQARKDCERLILEHYFGEQYNAVLGYIWNQDNVKIEDAELAELVGRYQIIGLYEWTSADTADDFWSEVNTAFSGSVLDGSPFGAADAEKYARFTWDRYGDA